MLVIAFHTHADDAKSAPPAPKPGSAEFERMKSLVGSWTGKLDMGSGLVDMTTTYRVIAGGSAPEERVFAGTPSEMTTMCFDQNGKISTTHYCLLGNRPQLFFEIGG